MFLKTVLFLLTISNVFCDLSQVYFVILSQTHPRHVKIGNETKWKLEQALRQNEVSEPFKILALHESSVKGGWTLFPLLPIILENSNEDVKWFLFLSESTEIEGDNFNKMISSLNPEEELFIGRAIVTPGDPEVPYPDLRSGFAISRKLAQHLFSEWQDNRNLIKETTWDAAYQFAKAISFLDNGPLVQHDSRFCTSFQQGTF
jgi:hypothetical protein